MSAIANPIDRPQQSGKIRVVIVDDSVVVRGLFSRWLSELPDVELVGIHRNGVEAVQSIGQLKPDVLLLDIEMPEMDGLTALPLLRQHSPETRILVISSMSLRGADITLRCLMRGATHYLPKPTSMREVSTSLDFRSLLISQVRAIGGRASMNRSLNAAPSDGAFAPVLPARQRPELPTWAAPSARPARVFPVVRSLAASPGAGELPTRLRPPSLQRPKLLVIGASTGGPPAVASFLSNLMPVLPMMPVVVAQHMPATFTMLFADHLRRQFGFDAVEISGGEILTPGRIHIGRGGQHLGVEAFNGGFRATAPVNRPDIRWQPSVNLLFETAALAADGAVLGVVLTGMGDDGAQGARVLAAAGGTVLAQDEDSSVVWGMPGAAFRTGACSALKPIDGLARYAVALMSGAGQ